MAININNLPNKTLTSIIGVDSSGKGGKQSISDLAKTKDLPLVSASSYGVKADGATDDTAALDAAFAAASAKYGGVQLPIGNIVYNGSGWNTSYPYIQGASRSGSVIVLGNNSRLIDSNQPWGGLVCRNLTIVGGKGAIRNTFTGVNVAGKFFVQECSFRNYTEAAIENNADDNPYWSITGNIFEGANYTTSIGIALRAWGDSNLISSNGFLANKIHIKLGRGGQNVYLSNNDFLRFGPGTQRVDFWIVPVTQAEYLIAGQGMTMRDCKFGSENLDPTDFAVLYAEEGTGATFGTKLPSFSASGGVISGHKITDCAIYGTTSNPTRSLVYSTVADVRGSEYTNIRVGGTPPKYLLEFSSDLPESVYNKNSIIGPALFEDQQAAIYQEFKLTNQPSIGYLIDTTGIGARTDIISVMPHLMRSSTGWEDFENLLNSSFTAGGYAAASGSAVLDSFSGGDAVELNITGVGGYLSRNFDVTPQKGKPVWFDFNLAAGSSTPLDNILFRVRNLTTNAIVMQEYLKSPASPTDWKEVRLLWVPRNDSASGYRFEFSSSTLGKIKISGVWAYHARQPLAGSALKGTTFISNTRSIPTTSPIGGGYLYVESGALKFRGSSGTITTIGPA